MGKGIRIGGGRLEKKLLVVRKEITCIRVKGWIFVRNFCLE